VLVEGNLWKIPRAMDIARESMGLIRQNWDLVFHMLHKDPYPTYRVLRDEHPA